MHNFIKTMLIEGERNDSSVSLKSTKKGKVVVESDHNVLFANFEIKYSCKEQLQRKETFNFECKDS